MIRKICILLCASLAALSLTSCHDTARSPTTATRQPETIPGGGGEVSGTTGNINGSHVRAYSFTPEKTGFWFFNRTTDGDGDMTFDVFEPDGDSIEKASEYTTIYLETGSTFTIEASYWKYTVGSPLAYTLSVSLAEAIPGGGGDVSVNGMNVYSFTPDRTGSWTFRTSGSSGGEPYLLIRDSERGDSTVAYYSENDGYVSYGDNDSSFDNTHLSVHLDEGSPYMIEAGCHYSMAGSFTFTATPPEQ